MCPDVLVLFIWLGMQHHERLTLYLGIEWCNEPYYACVHKRNETSGCLVNRYIRGINEQKYIFLIKDHSWWLTFDIPCLCVPALMFRSSPHLWPSPITMANTIHLQLAVSWIWSLFFASRKAPVFPKKERKGRFWISSCVDALPTGQISMLALFLCFHAFRFLSLQLICLCCVNVFGPVSQAELLAVEF